MKDIVDQIKSKYKKKPFNHIGILDIVDQMKLKNEYIHFDEDRCIPFQNTCFLDMKTSKPGFYSSIVKIYNQGLKDGLEHLYPEKIQDYDILIERINELSVSKISLNDFIEQEVEINEKYIYSKDVILNKYKDKKFNLTNAYDMIVELNVDDNKHIHYYRSDAENLEDILYYDFSHLKHISKISDEDKDVFHNFNGHIYTEGFYCEYDFFKKQNIIPMLRIYNFHQLIDCVENLFLNIYHRERMFKKQMNNDEDDEDQDFILDE